MALESPETCWLLLLAIWVMSIGAIDYLSSQIQSSLLASFYDQHQPQQQSSSPQAPIPNDLTQDTSVKTYLQRHEQRYNISYSDWYYERWEYRFAPSSGLPCFYGHTYDDRMNSPQYVRMLDLIKKYCDKYWTVSFMEPALRALRRELCEDIGLRNDESVIALLGEPCWANIVDDLYYAPCDICGVLERSPEWKDHPYWADEGYSRCIDCQYEEREEEWVYSRAKDKFVEWNEFCVFDVFGALVAEEHPMISDGIMQVIADYAGDVDIDQTEAFLDGYYIVHRILEPFGIDNEIPAAVMRLIVEYGAFMSQRETVLWLERFEKPHLWDNFCS